VLTFPLCATSPPTHLVPPTLFPYTTLFRSIWSFWSPVTSPSTQFVASEPDGHRNTETCTRSYQKSFICPTCICSRIAAPTKSRRSEEHTSELQSRFDLVCRLLLDKKKEDRH